MQETLQKHKGSGEKHEEPVHIPGMFHELWFERVASKLRLPIWLGIPLVSLGPAVIFWSLGIEIRIATDFTGVPVVSLPLLVLNMVFLMVSSRVICLKIEKLRQYMASLTHEVISES